MTWLSMVAAAPVATTPTHELLLHLSHAVASCVEPNELSSDASGLVAACAISSALELLRAAPPPRSSVHLEQIGTSLLALNEVLDAEVGRSQSEVRAASEKGIQKRDGRVINLALLWPMTGAWPVGRALAGAAALAVKRINSDENLVGGHSLEYNWADSACSASQSLKALGGLLSGAATIHAVIGPACSQACETTAHLSAGQNLAQISFACTSPLLSDKAKFPLFSRAVAPETTKGPCIIRSWDTMAGGGP